MTTAIRRALIATLLVVPSLALTQNTNTVDATVGNSGGILCTSAASNTNGAPLATNTNCGIHNPQPPGTPPVTNYNGFANANGTPYDQHAAMTIGGVVTPGTDLYITANTMFYMYLTLPGPGGTLRVNQTGNIQTSTGGAAPPSAAYAYSDLSIGAIDSFGMVTNFFASTIQDVNGPFNIFLNAALSGAPPTFGNTYLVQATVGVKGSFNNHFVAPPGGPPPQAVNFTIDGRVDAQFNPVVEYIDANGVVTRLSGAPIFIPTVTATPEPATMTLLATGLAGIAAARRKRRKADG